MTRLTSTPLLIAAFLAACAHQRPSSPPAAAGPPAVLVPQEPASPPPPVPPAVPPAVSPAVPPPPVPAVVARSTEKPPARSVEKAPAPSAEKSTAPPPTGKAAAPPPTERAAAPPAGGPPPPHAASSPAPPTLDLASLEERLKDTHAIGLFTKLSLKNQVDDLLGAFRAFHSGQIKTPLPALRQRYDLLLLKVLTLLQDGDPPLASAIAASREVIWGMLADRNKFQKIQLGQQETLCATRYYC